MSHKPAHLLLVDDDPGLLKLLGLRLTSEGYSVVTPYERRQLVARIEALSTEIPAQVRPLYQLWRDGQALQLQLAEERQRYSKLQQSSDSELDTLRQQHHVLQQQLELTTRKLENLTDIERQLSTRKPAGNFSPDTPHESEKPAPSTHEVTPDEP